MRTTTLFTLATCLAFTGIRPIAGQELTPLDRTPPTLKSMYYDVNGDGKMEYLDTENNKERFTAWFALDGTVVERVADDVLTIDHLLELNGDGKPDFIASDGNDTKMYLSQPDGSYKATSCPSLGSQLTQADLNRDGRMDLVFFKRIQSWPTLYAPYILLQTADGFQEKPLPIVTDADELEGMDYSSGGSGMFRVDNTIFSGAWIPERGTSYAQESDRMQALDLNADGYPDLFSPNGAGFISLPDGRYYTASMGTSVTACEVNGDGLTDYVLFDANTGDVNLMRSTPSGYETERLTNNSNLTDVQVCDLDGDGHQDLLLTIDKTKQTTYAFIIFLRNQGDGTFKKSEQGMEGEYTFHEVAYLDGKPGLTAVKEVTNTQGYLQYDFYLFQWDANFNLNGTMLLPEGYMLSNKENPFITDLNGDGKPDFLITPNNMEHYLYTLENAQPATVAAPEAPTCAVDATTGLIRVEWKAPSQEPGLTYEVRVGTAPGRGDIVQAQSNADGSRRTFANGNAGSATYLMLNAGTWPEGTYHIAVQAISPDGIGSAWSKETSFENHLVSPAFTASVNELSTADTLHIAPIYAREGANYQYNLQPDGRIVSQNADGSADISFESFGQKTVTLSLDGHTFTQGVQVVPFRTETNEDGYSGNVFDLNQDGWAEGFSERFYTNTQGTFKELMKSFNTDLNISHGGYVVDFNRDGRPDIYSNYLKVSDQQKRFLLNDGDMDFHAYEGEICLNTSNSPIGQYNYLTPIGDMDNDGRVDFIENTLMYKNTANGVWEEKKLYSGEEYIEPVAVADFNRDGYLDIVAAYRWDRGTPIYRQRLYLNQGDWKFEAHELPTQSSSLTLVGIADVNGDGRPDLIYKDSKEKMFYANLCDAELDFTERTPLPGEPTVDLNHDGLPEYVSATNPDSLIFQDKDGTLTYMENIVSGLSLELIPGNIGSSTPSGSYLDVDGDGTPDYDANLRIRSSFKNTAPTVPQNVYASQTTDGLTIYWDGATDKETPSHSLRYNLSVKKKGASGEGAYVISPLNLTDNKAQTGEPGYVHYRTATRFTIPTTALEAGQTYEIQVQAVDAWNAHSDFSPVYEYTAQAVSLLSLPGKGRVSWPIPFETTILGSPQIDTDGGMIDGNTIKWGTPGLKTVTLTVDDIVSRAQIEILDLPGMTIDLPQQILAGAPVQATLPEHLLSSEVAFEILRDEGVAFIHEEGQAEATFIFPEKDGSYDLNVKATDDVFGTIYQNTRVEVTGSGFVPVIGQIGTDEATGCNRISWSIPTELPAPLQPGTVRIYRETAVSDRYELLGEVPLTDGSYVDETSTPALLSQRYFITMATNYGGESRSSTVHANAHLMVNRAMGHDINLSWTPYEGRDVMQYVILSGPSPDRLTELTAVSGHTLSYTHARTSDEATYYALAVRFDVPQKRASADDARNRSNVVCSADAFDVTMAQSVVITSQEAELKLDQEQPQLHLQAVVLPMSTTLKRVQWSVVEGETLATVAQDGTVSLKDNATGGQVTVEAAATDGSGIRETVTLTAAPYTDIVPVEAEEVRIYATGGIIRIEGIRSATTLRLYNLQGTLLHQSEASGDTQISTSGLRGVYILQAGRKTQKLMLR
ncbi:MAG TPA: hypothetical protein DCE73_11750 [Paraprevotella xylaniphila]|jgi:hypothetical protein|nr:hypothetical protein [Paraprevotella xylaniphila]